VKCDEFKPSCKRCSDTGRKCEYSTDTAASSPDDSSGQVLIRRIATHIPGNAEEKRAFSYFLTNTAQELSGYFSSSFWEKLILQASSSEPALRHVVIAIGSLHEEFSQKRLEYSEQSTGFAMGQYTKAIGHLRRSLENGKQSTLAALMSCILFVCFDSVCGHFTAAMVHLQSGLRILRDVRNRPLPLHEKFMIENTIAPLFNRLSIQAILYVDTSSPDDRRAFASELMKTNEKDTLVPDVFSSLEEARNIINQSADGLFRMFYMCDGDLPYCYQPAESFELHARYSSQLSQWANTFEKFMTAKGRSLSSKELRGAALLKIQHTCVKIMAHSSVPDITDERRIAEIHNEPEIYISLIQDFQTIVMLSRSLIAAAEQDAKAGKASLTFSTDLGIVAPLYYTCTHCSDMPIREAAMELLKRCPRREGMWDGERTGVMVEEFWAIEERHKLLQKENEMGLERKGKYHRGIKLPVPSVIRSQFASKTPEGSFLLWG
jgi:hypothetical protein